MARSQSVVRWMGSVLVFSACTTTSPSTSPSSIAIQKPVHFSAADGSDVVAPAGVYLVDRVTDTTIRLVRQEGKDSLVIQAQTTKFDDPTTGLLALSVPYREDEHHVLLLMPDGNALDAVGTYSGVTTRATRVAPLSSAVIQQYKLSTTTFTAPSTSRPIRAPAQKTPPLWGWVDMHTHPMSHLAFGGKLFHGAPDIGSLLPAVQMPSDPACRFDARARSLEEALSDDAPTHGDPFQSKCGDAFRKSVIWAAEGGAGGQPGHRIGAVPPGVGNPSPPFSSWPKWNDRTHQKMWIEWIRRAKDGGLSVMVALSHNNRLLGEAVAGSACGTAPITCVTDDMYSSDLQITEMKAFVNRHPELMEVALNAADVYRIVQSKRIAIVLGVEVDNIGNFNRLPPGALQSAIIQGEIQRLYNQGVRYIFPVHLTDNVFGDTAIYDPIFNASNLRETGSLWRVECALPPAPPFPGDEIGFTLGGSSPLGDLLLSRVSAQLPIPPTCPLSGHRNGRTSTGLTPFGETAIKVMMKLGMIIDIDHMSQKAVERALQIAEGIPGGGYPLVSGHTGIRAQNVAHFNSENMRTHAQLRRIGCLQGMFGLGTSKADGWDWAKQYEDAFNTMGTSQCPNKTSLGPGSVAIGTDMNSLVEAPRPTMGPDLKPGSPIRADLYSAPGFPTSPSSTGGKTWDYNQEGVAHYGMLADFIKDVRSAPPHPEMKMNREDLVLNHLMRSADYFYRMWQRIEAQKSNVP